MKAQLTFFPPYKTVRNGDEYPRAPYVPESDTSYEAAKEIEPHLTELQADVLEWIGKYANCGTWQGLTCDEVEWRTGFPHQTVSARIVELRRKGLIEDSGLRRKTRSGRNATVWRVVK